MCKNQKKIIINKTEEKNEKQTATMDDFENLDLEELDAQYSNPCGVDPSDPVPTQSKPEIAKKDLCPRCLERRVEFVAKEASASCWECLDAYFSSRFKVILLNTLDSNEERQCLIGSATERKNKFRLE